MRTCSDCGSVLGDRPWCAVCGSAAPSVPMATPPPSPAVTPGPTLLKGTLARPPSGGSPTVSFPVNHPAPVARADPPTVAPTPPPVVPLAAVPVAEVTRAAPAAKGRSKGAPTPAPAPAVVAHGGAPELASAPLAARSELVPWAALTGGFLSLAIAVALVVGLVADRFTYGGYRLADDIGLVWVLAVAGALTAAGAVGCFARRIEGLAVAAGAALAVAPTTLELGWAVAQNPGSSGAGTIGLLVAAGLGVALAAVAVPACIKVRCPVPRWAPPLVVPGALVVALGWMVPPEGLSVDDWLFSESWYIVSAFALPIALVGIVAVVLGLRSLAALAMAGSAGVVLVALWAQNPAAGGQLNLLIGIGGAAMAVAAGAGLVSLRTEGVHAGERQVALRIGIVMIAAAAVCLAAGIGASVGNDPGYSPYYGAPAANFDRVLD